MRLYLAGPMRGYPEFNFPAFDDAAAKLRALGHEVFSPAESDREYGFDPKGMTGNETNVDIATALKGDLVHVCEFAEAVVVLPGWSGSLGANSEIAAARALYKPVWSLEHVLTEDQGIVDGVLKFMPVVDEETANLIGRNFESGAYRDSEDGKLDFEGFLSPLVLTEFAEYMNEHRKQSNGEMRASDNWQKGIPLDVYMKSMWRHFMDVWAGHRDGTGPQVQLDALMALLFNVQGYAHEILEGRSIVGD